MSAILDNKEDASYRDRLATVDANGKRKWIFSKEPKGKLTNYRRILAYFLITLLFVTPHLRIGGEPILLFNVIERKFVLFGAQFFPQDFHLAFMAMLTLLVFIILFTVVFGRLWCGWACPQTIFMEFVYRKIEYLIEGTPAQQRELDKRDWDTPKILKKSLKHIIFFGIAFLISNTFLAYIIGSDQLLAIQFDNPLNHAMDLTIMVVFSGVFYFVFAFFREQVCTLVCPYGRLQGVLLDSNSIAVSYDFKRGEQRGPFRVKEDRPSVNKGSCVDCRRCVQVCPTGIDIRDGSQLECINCTACMDECNTVMRSTKQPEGLIRYASIKGIETGEHFKFTTRNIAYMAVLGLLLVVFTGLMVNKSDLDATIVRTYNTVYQKQGGGKLSNMYNYKVINKTNQNYELELKLDSHNGEIKYVGTNKLMVEPGKIKEGVIFIILDSSMVISGMEINVGVYANGKKVDDAELTFVGPQ